jgi:ABC-2 type transport system permease protein
MSEAGSVGWFARHETRLAWRDFQALMTGGRRRTPTVVLGFTVFAVILHGMAWMMLYSSASRASADDQVLSSLTWTLLLLWSLMVSQAMETVTRAFFARGDLELILTSPAAASRLFAVRLAAMAATVVFMSLLLAAPFIHVLVWLGGTCWFGGYIVAVALAVDAASVAIVVIVAMFHLLGARRTRLAAQIAAAVIGAAFAIFLQFATILSYEDMPEASFSQLVGAVAEASNQNQRLIAWPAPEMLGDPVALGALLGASLVVLAVVIFVFAPRFGQFAQAAGNVVHVATGRAPGDALFRGSSQAWALRRKEWVLLLRDPWLMSQTLMQLLYLLPAVFLLWRNFRGVGGSALLVPILIVAAGQLGGGLAWLAVSGEDAPELIATAPMAASRVLRAKTEAVLGSVAVIFAPFVLLFGVVKPWPSLIATAGILIAALSAAAIQYWFRTQGRRSVFRRRQTSSRVATITEALSSTGWAATGAMATWGTWLFVFPTVVVLAILAGAWMISPARSGEGA